MTHADDDPAVALNHLVPGYGLSQAVYVAAKLSIPDLLVIRGIGPFDFRAVPLPR